MVTSQTVIPVMTMLVYIVQFFTGFFIPIEIQVGILYVINLFARMAFGRSLISGELKPAVLKRFEAGELQAKKIYLSKTFWIIVVGFLSIMVNGILHIWGINFELLTYTVPVLGVISVIIGAITKEPVELK